MDVTTSRLSDAPEVVSSRRFTPAGPPEPTPEATNLLSTPKPETPQSALKPKSPQSIVESLLWEPRSSLKLALASADVDLELKIHEGTKRVTMTMHDRDTGEIIREFPSSYVLDVIASLRSIGLFVDTAS